MRDRLRRGHCKCERKRRSDRRVDSDIEDARQSGQTSIASVPASLLLVVDIKKATKPSDLSHGKCSCKNLRHTRKTLEHNRQSFAAMP